MTEAFEALGDPQRRAIVELLATEPKSVQQLADALPISRPAVSRHLRLLKEARLVSDEAHGVRRIYHLHDEGVAAVQTYLRQVWGEAVTRFALVAENTKPSGRVGTSAVIGPTPSGGATPTPAAGPASCPISCKPSTNGSVNHDGRQR